MQSKVWADHPISSQTVRDPLSYNNRVYPCFTGTTHPRSRQILLSHNIWWQW